MTLSLVNSRGLVCTDKVYFVIPDPISTWTWSRQNWVSIYSIGTYIFHDILLKLKNLHVAFYGGVAILNLMKYIILLVPNWGSLNEIFMYIVKKLCNFSHGKLYWDWNFNFFSIIEHAGPRVVSSVESTVFRLYREFWLRWIEREIFWDWGPKEAISYVL